MLILLLGWRENQVLSRLILHKGSKKQSTEYAYRDPDDPGRKWNIVILSGYCSKMSTREKLFWQWETLWGQ